MDGLILHSVSYVSHVCSVDVSCATGLFYELFTCIMDISIFVQ
jgi:hypothetical protein